VESGLRGRAQKRETEREREEDGTMANVRRQQVDAHRKRSARRRTEDAGKRVTDDVPLRFRVIRGGRKSGEEEAAKRRERQRERERESGARESGRA